MHLRIGPSWGRENVVGQDEPFRLRTSHRQKTSDRRRGTSPESGKGGSLRLNNERGAEFVLRAPATRNIEMKEKGGARGSFDPKKGRKHRPATRFKGLERSLWEPVKLRPIRNRTYLRGTTMGAASKGTQSEDAATEGRNQEGDAAGLWPSGGRTHGEKRRVTTVIRTQRRAFEKEPKSYDERSLDGLSRGGGKGEKKTARPTATGG